MLLVLWYEHERSYQQYSITSRQIGVIKLVRAQLVVRYVSTREVCVLFVFGWEFENFIQYFNSCYYIFIPG